MSRRPEHEELEVYQAALTFITWLEPILRAVPKSLAVEDQLDRASTSIPLNIAEGNGKFTGADRCRNSDTDYDYDYDYEVRCKNPRCARTPGSAMLLLALCGLGGHVFCLK